MRVKQVLVLTNIYPAPDVPSGYTPVVHYFTKEWVKYGYDVRVIDYDINFPSIVYRIAGPFNSLIASKSGFVVKQRAVKDLVYEIDGVKVCRISMCKIRPHSLCSERQLDKAFSKTVNYLKQESFTPQVIISHWANPCVDLMCRLKQLFSVPTCYVSHGSKEMSVYGNRLSELLNSIDVVGFRSGYIKKKFESTYNVTKPSFQCYSGIPEHYITANVQKDFENIRKYIYVGTLISRKYPTSILPALVQVHSDIDFEMNYVGDGAERDTILKCARELGVENNVRLHGKVQRDEVVGLLDECDVFVMISRNEVYGLVYLEAMARGCITIASKREGFDGIIEHGYNGFLCEAGDSNELASILRQIQNMTSAELFAISNHARETAINLTDKKAALSYINSVKSLSGLDEISN